MDNLSFWASKLTIGELLCAYTSYVQCQLQLGFLT